MTNQLLYQSIFYLAGSAILLPFSASGIEKAEPKQDSKLPNVVILLADDQGYADVSYHEHPNGISTPAIDQLAKSGLIFTNGYADPHVRA